jgi:hypothetical protein
VKNYARFVFLLTLAFGFLCATTYPYLFLANHAKLTPQAAIFEKPGLISWNNFHCSPKTQQVVIRLGAKPYSINQEGPARILTISRDHYHSNVTIGQEGPDLIIRLRRDSKSELGVPPFVIPQVFDSLNMKTIEVGISENSLIVKVNGEEVLLQKLVDSPFKFWDAEYSLGLGNEHTWERPWIGEIYAVQLSVDSATTDLLASDSISRAGIMHLLRHKLVWVSTSIVDLVLNFALMLPFGALTAAAFPRHRIASSLGLWFILAAIAETTQALIPGRIPAISDLILNVMGAGVGAWLLVGLHEVGRCGRA